MRVLITGNLGFVGSHLTHWLLSSQPEVEVIGFSRRGEARRELRLAGVTGHPRLDQRYGDLTDRGALAGLCEGVDHVVHLAAKTVVDHTSRDPAPFIESNVVGSDNLMEEATRHGVGRFLQVSTDEVYGQILEGKYREDSPLSPRTPYAWSKAAADLDALMRFNAYGFPAIVTRTENNFGPYQHPLKALPVFTRMALAGRPLPVYGDGLNVRCWLYVEDHCRAIWFLLERGRPGEVYHVAGEEELTNLELARLVLRTLGKPEDRIEFIDESGVRPGHDRRTAIDVSKLRDLGWSPRHQLRERLEHTIRWYAEHPEWAP